MVLGIIGAAAFLCALIYAAISDTLTYEVSNYVPVGLVVGFLIVAPFTLTWTDIGWHAIVGAATLVLSFALFVLRVFGGADSKLLSAGALWFGWPAVLDFVLLVALLGGVLGLFLLAFRRIRLPARWLARPWVAQLHSREMGVPYCVAIALAGAIKILALPILAS